MSGEATYLVVRAASLYLAVAAVVAAWWWRRPSAQGRGAAVLAFVWNLPALLFTNIVAQHAGWWTFDARGGLLAGMPVDPWFGWSALWGGAAAIAFPGASLPLVTLLALAIDLVAMPLASPVVRLGPSWLFGEALALTIALIPSQLLARWTANRQQLAARATLQMLAFTGVFGFLLPAMTAEATHMRGIGLLHWAPWELSLGLQLLALPAAIGLSGVQEFVERGGGTPVPFDPPMRLVTSGVYAYVRNPMQLASVVIMLLVAAALRSSWLAAIAAMSHLYAMGFAAWDEDDDLRRRFGAAWTEYRANVRSWVPRLRPWRPAAAPPATLFIAETCQTCSEVALWFERHHPRGLQMLPAEGHPSETLRRMRYEPGDGGPAASGVAALARGFEHLHAGWMLIALVVRLPVVRPIVQLVVDASGGGERTVLRGSQCPAPSESHPPL